MRDYELAYIAIPDADEETLSNLDQKIQDWIAAAGGTIVDVDRWGRRKLAYPIRDYRDGIYTFVHTQLPAAGPAAIEADLKVNETVLRYMITRKEPA